MFDIDLSFLGFGYSKRQYGFKAIFVIEVMLTVAQTKKNILKARILTFRSSKHSLCKFICKF